VLLFEVAIKNLFSGIEGVKIKSGGRGGGGGGGRSGPLRFYPSDSAPSDFPDFFSSVTYLSVTNCN
jgi:hypothetical protein